uniref:Putative ovule protein n=1 Tax=Solanum chacoense TaxID=4108 RepID=A0A0V0GJN8_SOLCH
MSLSTLAECCLHGDSKNTKRKGEEFAHGVNIIQVFQDSIQFVFHLFENVDSVSRLRINVIQEKCVSIPHWETYYVYLKGFKHITHCLRF